MEGLKFIYFLNFEGHLSAGDADLLKKNMKSIWTTYFLPADFDNDKSVTVEELVVYMRSVRSLLRNTECIRKFSVVLLKSLNTVYPLTFTTYPLPTNV